MKRLIFALSAIALMGLASACVDQIETNPNFDPVNNTVTTQFVLNIAPADPQTKQSSDAVQKNHNFRGLNNASLMTFSVTDGTAPLDGQKIYTMANESMRKATSYIDLSYALKPGSINPWQDPADYDGSTPYSRRVVQIDLPTGTNTLVFYGEAVTGTSNDLKNDFGKLEYRKDGLAELDMTKIGCWAAPRLAEGSSEATDYHRIEAIIASVYNHLFQVQHTFSQSTYGPYNMDGVTVKWEDYLLAYDFNQKKTNLSPIPRLVNAHLELTGENALPDVQASPFEVILAKAYHSFMTVRSGELRAGSGKSVLRQMSDLYTVLYNGSQSETTSDLEDIARVFHGDITSYLSLFFDGVSTTSRVLTAWKSISGENGVVRALMKNRIDTLDAPASSKYTLNAFPLHFDIPIGGATMLLNDDGEFEYQSHNIPLPAMGGATMTVHDYTYPPSLVYYGNAPIRVSNSNSLTDNDFLDGAAQWETDASWNTATWLSGSETQNGFSHVTSNTRGVAMAYNIQYANALLETKVKFADSVINNNKIGLYDNNSGINGDPDNVFHPSSTATLQLTGVLVGGQPDTVGWNYLATSSAHFNKMVYDKRINSTTGSIDSDGGSSYALDIPYEGSDPSTPNYTTLFDNFDKSHLGGNDVYVALEFKNNLGDDFWGNANMVRNGGAFYLIGKLSIAKAKNKDVWSKKSKILPPYADAGTSAGETLTGDNYLRIFMQDYVTSAVFTIGKDALKSAYVTVPDLRSSSLSLGISVDLEWKEGLIFEDVPLGQM